MYRCSIYGCVQNNAATANKRSCVAASLCSLNTFNGQGFQPSVSILPRRIPKTSLIFLPGRGMCLKLLFSEESSCKNTDPGTDVIQNLNCKHTLTVHCLLSTARRKNNRSRNKDYKLRILILITGYIRSTQTGNEFTCQIFSRLATIKLNVGNERTKRTGKGPILHT
jgi:hypothetical protein